MKEEKKKASAAIYKQVAEKHGLYVWRCIAMLAMVEHLIYRASDEVRSINDVGEEAGAKLQESRIIALDYLDKTKMRFNSTADADEDEMADFYFHIEKTMKRKLGSFINAVIKNCKKLGVTKHVEQVSIIAVAMKLIESLNVYNNMTRQLPWYAYIKKNTPIERGLELLQFCYKHCTKMLDILDPDMHKQAEKNAAIDKQFNDIIAKWNDGKLYLKALEYANKQKLSEKQKETSNKK